MTFTRRVFLRWSTLATAAMGAVPAALRRLGAQQPVAPRELKGLEVKRLLPVASLVLPAELGAARLERATAQFSRWIAGFKAGEEIVHPYGSERLGVTGTSPAATWAAQLDALDTAARALDPANHPFALTTPAIRKRVLDDALAAAQLPSRVPSAISAPHIAIAMLAHFLDSPDARNLAYGRVIDPQSCRPLSGAPKEPVVLQRGGTSGRAG
jgi:hypothetical protein